MTESPEEAAALLRAQRKARDLARYQRRYARHKPTPPGRARTPIVHTLFPHSAPFNIRAISEACWGVKLRIRPVMLNRDWILHHRP